MASVKPGRKILYVARITNNGPSAATNVVVSEVLPPGLKIALLGGGCVAVPQGPEHRGALRILRSTLPPASTVWWPILWAEVDSPCGPIINTMTVSSDTP